MERHVFLWSKKTFQCLADSTMERLAGLGWDGMGGPGELGAALGLIKSNIALSVSFNLALIALQFDRWILNNRIMLTDGERHQCR